jgi:alpha-tubulin suppressor-like RCC1 family protein
VPEVSNGVHDDCNGVADDGFDVERDPENCGYCGRVCAVPVCIAGHCGEEIEIVSAGSGHTCAKRYGGRVACWGGASDGQLGDGTILDRPIPTEVRECGEDGVCVDADSDGAIDPPAVVSDAVDLALGRDHSCMVRASGAVSCWGDGQCGRLGSGRGGNTSLPLRTQGVSGALRVGAGDWTSCAVLDGGSVACWGIREDQNPADGCGAPRLTAEPVAGVSGVDEVDTGYRYGCARAGGEVFCWGLGQTGQLGDGTTTTRLAPGAAVTGLDDAIAISTGSGHACAVRAGGTVVCWGSDSAGQLGDGMMHADCGGTECSNVPVAVAGLADALLVSAGSGFTCALLRDGTARCWGQNDLGQLGNGGLTAAPTPTPVMNVADARHLSAGAQHACAVLATGGVSCWGNNRGARLGRGGAIPTADEPTPTAAPVLLLP